MSIPAALPREIPRPGLVRRIEESVTRGDVVVVGAPAGSGKTVAAAQWARDRDRVAWIRLSAQDNEPVGLLDHIIDSVRQVEPAIGEASRLLAAQGALDGAVDGLALLLDECGTVDPFTVVVDQVETLRTSSWVAAALADIVQSRPAGLGLVLLTQDDAALDLARLRTRSRLTEFGFLDLAFTVEELARVVSPGRAASIIEETTGWAFGVERALMVPDATRSGVAVGDADSTAVARSVADELEPGVRSFALDAAVLGRFCPELCATAFDRSDVADRLDRMYEAHLLPDPDSDTNWYTLNELVARAGTALLLEEDADRVDLVRRRAVRWCVDNGEPALGLRFAHDRGDRPGAVHVLLEHGIAWAASGRTETVLGWIADLIEPPPGPLSRAPADDPDGERADLLLVRAWAQIHSDRSIGAEFTLAEVDVLADGADDSPVWRARRAETHLVRSHIASQDGRLVDAYRHARLAEQATPDGVPDSWALSEGADVWLLLHAGFCAFWAGELAVAESEFALASTKSLGPVELATLRPHQAFIAWLAGGPAAEALADMALPVAEAPEDFGAIAVAPLAAIALISTGAHVEDATRSLTTLALSSPGPVPATLAALAHARAAAMVGDDAGARDAEAEALAEVASCQQPGVLPELVARLQLALGHVAEPPPSIDARDFTAADRQLISVLDDGLTERAIAQELFLAYNTVRTYRRRLYRKLGVSNREDALERARAVGLL